MSLAPAVPAGCCLLGLAAWLLLFPYTFHKTTRFEQSFTPKIRLNTPQFIVIIPAPIPWLMLFKAGPHRCSAWLWCCCLCCLTALRALCFVSMSFITLLQTHPSKLQRCCWIVILLFDKHITAVKIYHIYYLPLFSRQFTCQRRKLDCFHIIHIKAQLIVSCP